MTKTVETAVLMGVTACSATLALTYTRLPCYATICTEDYFSVETTIHIAVYYSTLAVISLALLLRAHVPTVRSAMGSQIAAELPMVGKRVTAGGLLTCLWILGLAACTTIFWQPTHLRFWGARADPLDWVSAKMALTATGVTAHYADILLGLLLIPTSRYSLVGRAFSLHQSTLLFAHKTIAYLFAFAAAVHGGAYMVSLEFDSQRNLRSLYGILTCDE